MDSDALLAALVAHLREDADFNRSWTDGRRGERDISAEYRRRRLEVAAERDAWANEVERLRSLSRELSAIREIAQEVRAMSATDAPNPPAEGGE